ncbi:hypothetical protein Gbem_2067 [Citrifermentans bemidjiense Bem]|uniref:EF-hand domain-containing protein n=1 Tax=Citrifermentans bemidjiense (strain ATCC BAA-1014 / DSM 16622 / JCM 12645 / Bem) TaxID=404380 RepID=B5ECP5_CITBB|nr:hypothetical protein [Citrifermentans bemidjiense]ACH39080.1 hypothetical protein Gbem_2067 [Citrifermentans bemidjiense Bem]
MCQRLSLRGALLGSLMLCLLLFQPQQSLAAPLLSLIPAGSGSFVLQGTGFSNVAGIDLTITYDSSRLSNPRLTQGPLARGAVTALNRNDAGTLLVSIIGAPAINGNGPVATVLFDQQGGGTGQISARGSIIDTLGSKQAVLIFAGSSTDTVQPPATPAPSAPASPASNHDQPGVGENDGVADPGTTPARTGARILGGSVSLPAAEAPALSGGGVNPSGAIQDRDAPLAPAEIQQTPTVGRPPVEKATADPAQPDNAPAADPAPAAPIEAASVLERFRTYTGQRSAAGFISLFAPGMNQCFRQEPAVGISTPGSILALTIPRSGDKAPNFAFQGCQAVSFRAGEDGWVLEVKPDVGAESALVVMLFDGIRQCPLALAPAADVDLDGSGKVTEADFEAYLKPVKGEAAIKRRDLNGDGRLDYRDDYIFTANYLAAMSKVGKK